MVMAVDVVSVSEWLSLGARRRVVRCPGVGAGGRGLVACRAGGSAGGGEQDCQGDGERGGSSEGHGLSPFVKRGGGSVVASSGTAGGSRSSSSGSGVLFPRPRGPVGVGAPSGPGGRAPGRVSSHPVRVTCATGACEGGRGE